MEQINSIIFGPIPSRRFGISLGVDLSPSKKQCNFDCLYCELQGAKTVEKMDEYPPLEDVVNAIKQSIQKSDKKIDVITITANGEPTLYPYLNLLIDEINKIKQETKVLILSNGSTIYKKEIFEALLKFDSVKLSLDCISAKCFKKLDRVHKNVECEKIVDYMDKFSRLTKNFFAIEVLFVKDLNDTKDELELLHKALKQINPSRVDIGTIDRPPAYNVKAIEYQKLEEIAEFFSGLNVNIVYKKRPKQINKYNKDEIVELLKRRALTSEDIESSFDSSSKIELEKLVNKNIVKKIDSNGVEFYKIL